jgi:ketosteroid isomerase-like protein
MASCAARVRTMVWSGALWAALACAAAAQNEGAAQAAIRAALAQWTEDFNAGRADKVCDLFAPDLIAQYRGQPERDYNALCGLLRQSLADRTKTFAYSLAIDEILVSGNLAVVRLVWTLKVQRRDAPGEVVTSREPGMDICRRQPDGSWKISRYIAYEAPP